MRVTPVRGHAGRRLLAVQLEADVGADASDNIGPMVGELRRLPDSDPRAAVLVARGGGVMGERKTSAEWRRLVSLRHLLRRDELPDELVVLELLEPGFGFRDVGFTVFPGDNPLPFLIDVNDVPAGPYLFSIERWTTAVYIPPVYVP